MYISTFTLSTILYTSVCNPPEFCCLVHAFIHFLVFWWIYILCLFYFLIRLFVQAFAQRIWSSIHLLWYFERFYHPNCVLICRSSVLKRDITYLCNFDVLLKVSAYRLLFWSSEAFGIFARVVSFWVFDLSSLP